MKDGTKDNMTQKQEELAHYLGRYGERARSTYLGALYALHQKNDPDHLSHFAYSLRDVIDILAKTKLEKSKHRYSLKKEKRSDLLKKTFDSLTEQLHNHDTECEMLANKYGRLSSIAHGREQLSDDTVSEILSSIEEILHKFSMPQTRINDDIDDIVSQEPTAENAEKLVSLQFGTATQLYVIRNLPADWLPFMMKTNFFRMPKKGEYWVAHQYLSKCLQTHASLVTDIILSYNIDVIRNNKIIYADFLRYMLSLPMNSVEKIVEKMLDEKWYEFFGEYPERYMDVVEKLYLNEKYDLAVDLIHHAFIPLDNNADDLHFSHAHLETILKKYMPKIIQNNPIPILKILVTLLERYIISATIEDDMMNERHTGLSTNRPSIEDSDQNWLQGVESELVTQIRNSLSHMGNIDKQKLYGIMPIIREKNLPIYRRIELFIYDRFPDMFKDEIENCALLYFGKQYAHHEYYVLLKNHFSSLSVTTKKKILKLIEDMFDTKEFKETSRKFNEKVAKIRWERMQFRYLNAIRNDLDDHYNVLFLELAKECSEIKHPDYIGYKTNDYSHPITTSGSFTDKSTDQIFKIIMSHHTEKSLLYDDHIMEFSNYVADNSLECSKKSTDLRFSDASVQLGFFNGLERALHNNDRIDWRNVVLLLDHICVLSSRNREPIKYHAIVQNMSSLLRWALVKDKIEIKLQNSLWVVIKKLVEIGLSDFDEHVCEFIRDKDTRTISINSIDGTSFHVLCLYIIWCTKHDMEKTMVSEAWQVLDDYISNNQHHTISRHSVLGSYFRNLLDLNRPWTITMLKKISSNEILKLAFWDGYVKWNPLYSHVFEDLRKWYAEFLNGKITKKLKKTNLYESTIEHSLLAYFYDIDNDNGILERFLKAVNKKTNESVIKHCIFHVDAMISDMSDDSKFNLDKLKKLWKHDFISQYDLSRWFINSPMDKKTSIQLYLEHIRNYQKKIDIPYYLLDELETYADELPLEVLDCLDILVNNPADKYIPDNIKNILKNLAKHDDKRVKIKGKKIAEIATGLDVECRGIF